MTHTVTIVCTLSLLACTGGEQQPSKPSGDNEPIELRIHESADSMSIVGLDGKGNQVASVQFDRGTVTLSDDDGRVVDGLQIDANVYGLDWHHKSEGRSERHLKLMPTPGLQRLNDFLVDPRVQAVAARWQVEFVAPAMLGLPGNPPASNTAFRGCTYSAGANCNPSACGEYDVNIDYYNCVYASEQLLCCVDSNNRVYRECGVGALNGCGKEGPNGCAVCGTTAYGSSCQVITGGFMFADCYPDGSHGIWTDSVYFSN